MCICTFGQMSQVKKFVNADVRCVASGNEAAGSSGGVGKSYNGGGNGDGEDDGGGRTRSNVDAEEEGGCSQQKKKKSTKVNMVIFTEHMLKINSKYKFVMIVLYAGN